MKTILYTLFRKMNDSLAQQAVNQALSANWEKAIQSNLLILKTDPKNIDALNRIARAYAETGNLKKAKINANKVLKIDPFNNIAKKSLSKWESIKDGQTIKSLPSRAEYFLEEPGKTKIVSLMHLCDKDILAKLDAGDQVNLSTHSHRVSVATQNGIYIGKLPDDISAHIKKLIDVGNKYSVLIKSISQSEVKVFIRETHKSEEMKDIPSFTAEKVEYISFTSPDLVHDKDDLNVRSLEEEEEDDL